MFKSIIGCITALVKHKTVHNPKTFILKRADFLHTVFYEL